MSRSINGFIEFKAISEGWVALVDISYLINISAGDDRDAVHVLFDFMRFKNSPDLGFEPAFQKVPFPDDISKKVGIEAGVYDENTYAKDEIVKDYFYPYFDGFVVSWAEIKAIDWKVTNSEGATRRDYLSGNWQTVFKLMETLADGYKNNNVRLIVWFN